MKGVGVFHDEFTAAHDAEAGPDLVAKFGLDLVIGDGQLFVALEFIARQIGDDFLVGRSQAEIPLVAVLQTRKLRTVLFPASRFLPQFRRLQGRHQHFQRAGTLHFLPYDPFHVVQDADTQRQPGIQAGGKLADQAGANHQLVAGDLGIGRCFFDGIERKLGSAHDGCLSRLKN